MATSGSGSDVLPLAIDAEVLRRVRDLPRVARVGVVGTAGEASPVTRVTAPAGMVDDLSILGAEVTDAEGLRYELQENVPGPVSNEKPEEGSTDLTPEGTDVVVGVIQTRLHRHLGVRLTGVPVA